MEDFKLYINQQNIVTKLNKNLKKSYFKEKLLKGKMVQNFWNNKPTTLIENDQMLKTPLKYLKLSTITLLTI